MDQIHTRIATCVIAALALGLSACTNPYDPVQRGLGGGALGAASGAAIGAAAAGGPGALLEQQSVEQPGYSGDSLLRLRRHRAPITVIPSTATQRTAIPLTDTQPMGIRPTHSRAIAIQATRAPRPMDTPAALDTRPTPVHRVTVHQSVWRSRITSVLPAMNREPNWDIRLTLVLPAMKTRGTWEKPRCGRLRAMNTGARLLLPLTPFSVIAFRSSSSLARRA